MIITTNSSLRGRVVARSYTYKRTLLPSAIFLLASFVSLPSTKCQAMATTAVSSGVPERMHLSSLMKDSKNWLSKASLIPIDFSPTIGDAVKEESVSISGSEAVKINSGKSGSICFVVRRPGWVLCREHGQQLTELAASEDKSFEGFDLFGVIKETGVDDEGLRVFQGQHFSYPIYRDENLDFYRAFGDGKITDHLSWWSLLNPYKIYKEMKKMNARMKSKNLEGNLVGEGLKTGGIIVFGSDGEPKYAYPEITGSAIEVDDLVAAVKDVRSSQESAKTEL